MVARAHGDALVVQGAPHFRRLVAGQHERGHAGLLERRADQAHAGNGLQLVRRVFQQRVLIGGDVVQADALHVIDGRTQAHGIGDIARARLETVRHALVDGTLERNVGDHVAAALPWRQLLQQVRLAIYGAYARRAEHFMARKHVKIRTQRLHVHAQVRHGLRAIDQHAHAGRMRQRDDLRHGRHRPQRIRHLRHGHQPGAPVEQLAEFIEEDLAAVIDRNHAQDRALFRRQLLPWHDIGVMLELRDDDFVAAADDLAAKGIGDQVDALGGATDKNDFIGRRGAQEVRHLGARRLVRIAGARCQCVGGAVDVRILVRIEIRHPVDHRLRLVRGGRIVEPGQRLAVDPFGQHGKVAPYGMHVERCRRLVLARFRR